MSGERVILRLGRIRKSLRPRPERSLARLIFQAGLWEGVPLCAGLGKCGLCRVRFLSPPPPPRPEERARLGDEALAQGWRLSCLHPAVPCSLELPEPRRAAPRSAASAPDAGGELGLAVDLGTTSIHWALASGGRVLATGQGLNPQMGLGSEVMSRLACAQAGGAGALRRLVLGRLRDIARQAAERCGRPVERLCVAGNSAMTYLLLGRSVRGLAGAPYRLRYAGGDQRRLDPALPDARIPPLLAPFVGADLSAGLAALRFCAQPPRHPYLLADLGTNGEFVLALSEQEYLLASVPLGPALEGVGLRHGRTAAPGAVRAFTLGPAGLTPQHIERPPLPGEDAGITGVGYLSLAAALLRAGVLDEHGRFVVPASPLGRRIAKFAPLPGGEQALDLGAGLLLPASDMEELAKVKAAFNLALSRLLAEAGLTAGDLTALHLAGALGEHVEARDLSALGFVPAELEQRLLRAGNTSLKGALLLLDSPQAWDWVRGLPGRCRVLDLAADPRFGSMFVQRMVLRHVP